MITHGNDEADAPPLPGPPPLATGRARSFWPDARHEALLLAALAGPPRLQAALAAWDAEDALARADYPTLTTLPLLYRNLCRHGVEPALRGQLAGVYRWSWHRNQLLLSSLGEALAALREAGVEVASMKGVPLALYVHRDLGARVMGDADLVVRRHCAAAAIRALAAAGWRAERTLDEPTLASLGGVGCRNARGQVIDLHWHVFPECFDSALDARILDRARPVAVAGEQVLGLDPADHLVLLICHGLSWAANAPLHWVADAVLLLREHGADLDGDRVVELCGALHRTHCVRAALRYLVDRFDAPVPAGLLTQLDRERVGGGERAAFWFAERSGSTWPWGRAPLVAAMYLRSSRAQGRRPGPIRFLRFLSARAGCTPGRWLRRAAVDSTRHLGRMLTTPGRLSGGIET